MNQTKATSPYRRLITHVCSVLWGVCLPVIVNPSNRIGILFTHRSWWRCRASLSTVVGNKAWGFLHSPDARLFFPRLVPVSVFHLWENSSILLWDRRAILNSSSTNMLYSVVIEQCMKFECMFPKNGSYIHWGGSKRIWQGSPQPISFLFLIFSPGVIENIEECCVFIL